MSNPNPDRHFGEHNLPDLSTSRWVIEVSLRQDQHPIECRRAFRDAKRRGEIATAHVIGHFLLEIGLDMKDDETSFEAHRRLLEAIPNQFIRICGTPKICAEFD